MPLLLPPFWEWRPRRPRHIRWRTSFFEPDTVALHFGGFNLFHDFQESCSGFLSKQFDVLVLLVFPQLIGSTSKVHQMIQVIQKMNLGHDYRHESGPCKHNPIMQKKRHIVHQGRLYIYGSTNRMEYFSADQNGRESHVELSTQHMLNHRPG